MLMVQLTVNGVVRYFSNTTLDVEHFYEPLVVSLDELSFSGRTPHGGWAEPNYGNIVLLPSAFDGAGEWEPPQVCPIKVFYGLTGETGSRLMFAGTAYRTSMGAEEITYAIYPPEYTAETGDAYYRGTLNAVLTDGCTALGLTLNTTYARAPSPAVDYPVSGEGNTKVIDNMSDIAAFYSHRFFIENGVLYLVDCHRDAWSVLNINTKDAISAEYVDSAPLKKLTADYTLPRPYNIQILIKEAGGQTTTVVSDFYLTFRENDPLSWHSPTALSANYAHATYPITNARDNVATTYWSSSGYNLVDNILYAIMQYGAGYPILKYRIKAYSNPIYTPTRWEIYGRCENRMQYKKMGEQESNTPWLASEARDFDIPDNVNAPISLNGSSLAIGEEINISPVCHPKYANIVTALTNIRTIVQRDRFQIQMPMPDKVPVKLAPTPAYTPKAVWQYEQGYFVNDMSGNAANLSIVGSVQQVNESFEGGGCAYFSHTNEQRLAIADAALPAGFPFKNGTSNQKMTLLMRFKAEKFSATKDHIIWIKWNGGYVYFPPNGTALNVFTTRPTNPAAVSFPAQFKPGKWYTMAVYVSEALTTLFTVPNVNIGVCVWDEEADKYLIEPTAKAETGSGAILLNTGDMHIGGYTGADPRPFYGWIDETLVYNSIISLQEIEYVRAHTYKEMATPQRTITEITPRIGQRVEIVDESLLNTTKFSGRVSGVVFDFNENTYVIEGEIVA